jgi:peroxiredoxin
MKNDSLRELVIIKNLWELYYSAEFDPNAVRKIVSDINVETKIEKHREITAHMLGYFNKMQNGSPAPMIKARNKTGGISDLVELKGKWIYLNFFSTKKTESAREMYKIASLKKKMGDRLLFVSICTDDSLTTYTGFIKANPKLDWNIWYNSDKRIQKNAKESYFVTGSEAYFLIDNNGYLAQSPALSPSGGIEYKLNSIFKPVRKNIKTGIR